MFNVTLAFYGTVAALAVSAAAGGYGYYKGHAAAEAICAVAKLKNDNQALTRNNKELGQLIVDNNTLNKGVTDAIQAQSKEIADVRAAVAGSNAAVKRLSTTTVAASDRLSNATRAAAIEYAAAANEVLRDSAERYRELGEKADGHVADVRALRDGWPKLPAKEAVK